MSEGERDTLTVVVKHEPDGSITVSVLHLRETAATCEEAFARLGKRLDAFLAEFMDAVRKDSLTESMGT